MVFFLLLTIGHFIESILIEFTMVYFYLIPVPCIILQLYSFYFYLPSPSPLQIYKHYSSYCYTVKLHDSFLIIPSQLSVPDTSHLFQSPYHLFLSLVPFSLLCYTYFSRRFHYYFHSFTVPISSVLHFQQHLLSLPPIL